ncbi:hypothetical protein V3W47_01615 [Deinococcus sp. YIM 134068]|uniref:hypothetical protein n=1 Tax=Deinococcus lichenicola TaxID=3118910 RepID=UPI002F954BFA
MESPNLERLLRELNRAFDQLVIFDWYDGVLSSVALMHEEEVAIFLRAVWADCPYPEADSYLYRVSSLPYTAVALRLSEVASQWVNKQAEVLEELLPSAKPENLLLLMDRDSNRILSVWRQVDPGMP